MEGNILTWRCDIQSVVTRARLYLLLDVLYKEGGRPQVVHWAAEESLDLLLMEVHGDDVR